MRHLYSVFIVARLRVLDCVRYQFNPYLWTVGSGVRRNLPKLVSATCPLMMLQRKNSISPLSATQYEVFFRVTLDAGLDC